MGLCKFCGQKAGLFKSVHKECEANYLTGKNIIETKISEAITSTTDFTSFETEINTIAQTSYLSKDDVKNLYSIGFDRAIESFLEDGVISVEEEEKISNFKSHFNFDQAVLDKNGSLQKVVKALILRDVINGNTIKSRMDINGTLPFLLQKDETIIWLFQNVEFYELRDKTTYHGSSKGVSIKIAKGLYYRTSSFKGNPVTNQQMTILGNGMLALTNKNLYFGSSTKNLKIPYNKLISLTPYSDGVGLQKDGVSAKPQIFKNLDGWFTYNLISNFNNL